MNYVMVMDTGQDVNGTHSHSGRCVGWDQDHVAGLHDYWQPYAKSQSRAST